MQRIEELEAGVYRKHNGVTQQLGTSEANFNLK